MKAVNMESTILQCIFILTLLYISMCEVCDLPQKYTYLSYKSLSKRDTLPDMFTQLSKSLSKYSASYSDTHTYSLTNIGSTLIYNEHSQIEKANTQQTVRVELGSIKWIISFNYLVKTDTTSQSGIGQAELFFDHNNYFIKELTSVEGELEWTPTQTPNLAATNLVQVVMSQPKLPLDYKLTIQKILSDNTNSTNKIKETMLTDINTKYKTILKEHLNKENLFPDRQISYTYKMSNNKTISLDFECVHKNYTIQPDNKKGIQIPFFFGLKNDKTDCTSTPFVFNLNDHGGVQQALSMKVIESVFKSALRQGLYDVTLDRKWEVNVWQFYMGDLANIVSQANSYPADDPIEIMCEWDKNESTIKVSGYSDHEIYTEAKEVCKLLYKNEQKISFSFILSIIVRIITEKDFINFEISRPFKNKVQFTPIDPKFAIANEAWANQVMKDVIYSMQGSKIFGSGWMTVPRRFPSSYITSNYLLLFDPSQTN